jgi:hypothetical protein
MFFNESTSTYLTINLQGETIMADTNTEKLNDEIIVKTPILKKFQDELAVAMEETLSGSELNLLLENYGLVDGIVRIQCEIDTNKLKSSPNLDIRPELKNALEASSTHEFVTVMCCTKCLLGICCPCSSCC